MSISLREFVARALPYKRRHHSHIFSGATTLRWQPRADIERALKAAHAQCSCIGSLTRGKLVAAGVRVPMRSGIPTLARVDGGLVYIKPQYFRFKPGAPVHEVQALMWMLDLADIRVRRVGPVSFRDETHIRDQCVLSDEACVRAMHHCSPGVSRATPRQVFGAMSASMADVLSAHMKGRMATVNGDHHLGASLVETTRESLATTRIVVVDTETTGLTQGVDVVVQIAWCRAGSGWSTHADPETRLLRTGVAVSESARKVHGIDDSVLSGAPPPEVALRAFAQELRDADVLCAYNAAFDVSMIIHTMMRFASETLSAWRGIRVFDVFQHMYLKETGGRPMHVFMPVERVGMRLTDAYELAFEGRQFPGAAHDALSDTLATRDLLCKYLASQTPQEESAILYATPPRVLSTLPWLEATTRSILTPECSHQLCHGGDTSLTMATKRQIDQTSVQSTLKRRRRRNAAACCGTIYDGFGADANTKNSPASEIRFGDFYKNSQVRGRMRCNSRARAHRPPLVTHHRA